MISKAFFNQSVVELAKNLLGCELIHLTAEGLTAGRIVETEAYHQTDAASHSFRGKTTRTEVMFGPPGHVYVYFTYGMHWCFNITAEREGIGAAVLIRALEPTQGIDLMKQRRHKDNINDLCSGPSKLVQAMGITKDDYGKAAFKGQFQLKSGTTDRLQVCSGPRIGISQAKDKKWRFWLKDSAFVSR